MDEQLLACLREAQRTGSVGPGALEDHLEQAAGYAVAIGGPLDGVCVDLGSGGGLPALPLALSHPSSSWTLVEAWARRAALLRRFVRVLELGERVVVLAERAELVGHGARRGAVDVVTARAFAPPAVTLECAAPLLRPGGSVVLSVREDEPGWPLEQLERLGLATPADHVVGRYHYRSAHSTGRCDPVFPRRPGVPERSPLF